MGRLMPRPDPAYQALREALLRELSTAYQLRAVADFRIRELLEQLQQAQEDHREEQIQASRERLYRHWSERTGQPGKVLRWPER